MKTPQSPASPARAIREGPADNRGGDGADATVCVAASDLSQSGESARSDHDLLPHQLATESAQAALRASERRYRSLLDTALEGIWLADTESRIVDVNDCMAEMLGSAREELIGRSILDFVMPDDVPDTERRTAARLTGVVERYERRLRRADGSTLWTQVSAAPLRDEQGCVVGFFGTFSDITDRKRSEEVAQQRLAEIEDLYRNAPVGLCVLDRDLRYLRINERLAEINGVPAADHLGRTVRDVLPGLAEAVESEMRRTLQTGEPRLDIEIKGETPARPGVERSWLEQWLPITDDQGRVTGLSIVVKETTERKRTEAALRASEERLRRMIETSPVAIGFGDSTGRIFEANEAFYRLTGYTREEIRASRLGWDRLTAPEYAELDRHIMATLAETGSAGPYEKEYIRKDGSRVPLLLSASKLQGRDEHVAFIVDITARVAAEEAMRRIEEERKVGEAVRAERQRLFDVLEALPAMIFLLTPGYNVAFANRGFREAFGELNGRRCYEYCFGRTAPCEFCRTYDVLATGRPVEWEVTTPEGRVIEVHNFPFTDVDGAAMILEMELDITERRRAEQELRTAHEQLAERAAQLRALAKELTLSEQRERQRLARVLHDHLQQLLVGAKFRTAIVARMGDELIRQAAAEIELLLDRSITVSRSLTAELSPPVLHEAGLTGGLEWLARWMAEQHGLRVNLSPEENLPALSEEVRVLLFESVRELLFNTVKHAGATSAHVSVSRAGDGGIRIAVSDAGPGFDPAILKKAGETGGGFGLFGIQERLELMGGRLDIESAPGKGSRFVLSTPVGDVEEQALPDAPAAGPPPKERQRAPAPAVRADKQIGVLIADDHPVVREGFRRLLGQERDIQIVGEAADGQEAVEMAGALRPDVILMDVSMPKLNGLEATRAIHRDYPDIQIIGLSMFEDEEHAQAMREAGATAYRTKSGPPRELILAIRRAGRPPAQSRKPKKPAGRAGRKEH